MDISQHPTIRSLAETDTELLPLFSLTERIIIQVCKELVEADA